MQEGLTIKDFFYLIKKRIIMISMTMTIVTLMTGVIILFLFKPVYEAKEYILIGDLHNTDRENSYEETQKIPRMMASSIDFIKSPIVLDAVKKELGLHDTPLEKKLFIENNKDSQIVTITAKDQNAELARKIAKTTVFISIEKMNTLLKFDGAKILEKSDDLIEKNNIAAALVIALIVGMFSGVGLAVVREQLDDSIKSEKTVEDLLDVPLLGEFSDKAKIRKSRREIPFYDDKERREVHAKEKTNQADRATTIS
ncbi:Wzz/FepE/Etk N-terminal domain-containing protein [Bacillus sp. B190/17]|uniref:Wzz/FepE/Etk N-terminal domain-containing protein n=1 Tax=Bacillus lumedeiriae TaxID=3058829 RepID=A0ABW8IB28_9BACI